MTGKLLKMATVQSFSFRTPGISVYRILLYYIFYVNILFQIKNGVKKIPMHQIKEGQICSLLYKILKQVKIPAICDTEEPHFTGFFV